MNTKEIKELLYFYNKSEENVHLYLSDSDEIIVKKINDGYKNEINIRLGKLPDMIRLTKEIIKHYTNQLNELNYKNYTPSIYNSYSLFNEHVNILQCNLQN